MLRPDKVRPGAFLSTAIVEAVIGGVSLAALTVAVLAINLGVARLTWRPG